MTKKPPEPTVADVYEKILDVREHVLDLKDDFADLKEHVNDELEMMDARIEGKVEQDALLTSLGFHLLNNRWARWLLGVTGAAVVSTVFVRHWLGPFAVWLEQAFTHF